MMWAGANSTIGPDESLTLVGSLRSTPRWCLVAHAMAGSDGLTANAVIALDQLDHQ